MICHSNERLGGNMFHINRKCLFVYLFLVLTFYYSESAYTQTESFFWQSSSNEFGRQMAQLCRNFDNISACLKLDQSITRQEMSDISECVVSENRDMYDSMSVALGTDFEFDESEEYEEFTLILDDYINCVPKRKPIFNKRRAMRKINECTFEYANRSREGFGCTALEKAFRVGEVFEASLNSGFSSVVDEVFEEWERRAEAEEARYRGLWDDEGSLETVRERNARLNRSRWRYEDTAATQGGAPIRLQGAAKREWDNVSAEAKNFVCESWDVLSLCIEKKDEALQLTPLTPDNEFNIAVNTMRCITDTIYVVHDSLTFSKNYRFLGLGFNEWNELVMDFRNCENVASTVLGQVAGSATLKSQASTSAYRRIDRCIDDYINKSRQTMACSIAER